MQYQWFYKNRGNDNKVEALANDLNISKPNARLLIQRGINTFDEAKNYFRPQLKDLHDPFLMKDMDKAVERLTTAIEENQKVLIYGDYDVDGTTSVALMHSFLKNITQNIDYYVPNREGEGYGISFKGVDFAKENNFELVIALDCGIKANDKIKYANELGIDFIICDHHLPGEKVPNASAILDPKQLDCSYPDKNLSGCGVGFKLAQAFAKNNNIPIEDTYTLLDLVAVSIASDIVPIIGENRILAYYGLQILNQTPRVGLQSLIQIANLSDSEIKIKDIVFKIGPRINAAGRINTARHSVDLLIEQDYTKAEKNALAINSINTQRKDLDTNITAEAIEKVNSNHELLNKKSTVLCDSNWHKGVLGIVASRLVEQFYKPTIILTETDGILTGSARSVKGFNIYEAIDACSHLIEGYGGHMYAAGLNLKKENFEAFVKEFEEYVANKITPDLLIPKIEIDLKIKLSDINQKFYNIIKQMSPFGPDNMEPVFVMQKLDDTGQSKIVGKDETHLKLSVKQEDSKKNILTGIAFGKAEYYPSISKSKFALCFHLSENEFRGNKNLQLDVKEIQNCDEDEI